MLRKKGYRESLNVTVLVHSNLFIKPKYKLNSTHIICGQKIPASYISDIATIPRWIWWLLPPVACYAEAALVHDWLLDNGVNRLVADKAFTRVCNEYKVTKYASVPMRALISIFGFIKKPRDYM